MAMNPMQRKANNYFLMGVLITVLIAGAIIAFLYMQLDKLKKENKKAEAAKKEIYVVAEDLKSGQIVTEESFTMKRVPGDLIPESATTEISEMLSDLSLQDKNGRSISADEEGMYYTESGIGIKQDDDGGYYYEEEGRKIYIELEKAPIITKIALNKNTVITPEVLTKADERTTKDLRKEEYNMIILPSQISSGDYVDIRLRLSNGVDYIVLSKKHVTIPMADGVTPSEYTMSINLNETERMVLANAIIDAYQDNGSLLYATTYVEPGMQESIIPTYVPNAIIQNQLNANPNIEQEAKNALFARYNQNATTRTGIIDPTLAQFEQDKVDNIEAGVQQQITRAREERQRYLQALSGN